jgi:hypothetical protein
VVGHVKQWGARRRLEIDHRVTARLSIHAA